MSTARFLTPAPQLNTHERSLLLKAATREAMELWIASLRRAAVCVCVYIYIYIYVCVCV
jgi:hypothetical protein